MSVHPASFPIVRTYPSVPRSRETNAVPGSSRPCLSASSAAWKLPLQALVNPRNQHVRWKWARMSRAVDVRKNPVEVWSWSKVVDWMESMNV